jgi:hypothetical protein
MFSLGITRHRLGYSLRIARPDPHLPGAIARAAVAVTDVPSALLAADRFARISHRSHRAGANPVADQAVPSTGHPPKFHRTCTRRRDILFFYNFLSRDRQMAGLILIQLLGVQN